MRYKQTKRGKYDIQGPASSITVKLDGEPGRGAKPWLTRWKHEIKLGKKRLENTEIDEVLKCLGSGVGLIQKQATDVLQEAMLSKRGIMAKMGMQMFEAALTKDGRTREAAAAALVHVNKENKEIGKAATEKIAAELAKNDKFLFGYLNVVEYLTDSGFDISPIMPVLNELLKQGFDYDAYNKIIRITHVFGNAGGDITPVFPMLIENYLRIPEAEQQEVIELFLIAAGSEKMGSRLALMLKPIISGNASPNRLDGLFPRLAARIANPKFGLHLDIAAVFLHWIYKNIYSNFDNFRNTVQMQLTNGVRSPSKETNESIVRAVQGFTESREFYIDKEKNTLRYGIMITFLAELMTGINEQMSKEKTGDAQ